MRRSHKQLKIKIFLLIILTASFLLPALSPSLAARKPIRWRAKKIVVIDPGHGGHESGARGPSGVLEKDVTIKLARRIESELKSRFKVRLTRTGDYGLEITRRTDVANHLEADVFISIHVGGSFEHDAHGLSVFYFRDKRSPLPTAATAEQRSWDRLQFKHVQKSRMLARSVRKRLEEELPGTRCKIDAAALMVLRGADMPAVLIEVGTLTNTDDEKRLNQQEALILLGQAIADGVNDFLRRIDGGSGQ